MNQAGIYIHIPFCRSRCSYCDFATGAYDAELAARYVEALTREIRSFERAPQRASVDTVYFGGGTPSLLSVEQTERILRAVGERFNVAPDAEITLEMNPGTVTRDGLKQLRALGVNRASFGAQTFDDAELRRLGRTHTSADARRTFADLRAASFENISFDLIAALPEQTIEKWSQNLDEALRLRPEHLSLYLLEVHKQTPLYNQLRANRWTLPDEDETATMYEMLIERTRVADYVQYEISNFCLPGFESRHNTKYWTRAPVFGFGCSAHSFDGRTRWANERNILRYLEMIEKSGGAIVTINELDADEAAAESLFLGLRLMRRGVDLRAHLQIFGADVRESHADDLTRFHAAGLIELNDDVLRLTARGALLSNEVFAAFV
jgi:oxygen-independent coproporphyrinogen-3 oxidase